MYACLSVHMPVSKATFKPKWLSDAAGGKWQIPRGTVISGHGYTWHVALGSQDGIIGS